MRSLGQCTQDGEECAVEGLDSALRSYPIDRTTSSSVEAVRPEASTATTL